MTARKVWAVNLAAAAEADFADAVRWSAEHFGIDQALRYAEILSRTLAELTGGPTVPGARPRDDIAAGVFSLHVARRGAPGRHVVIFRVGHDGGRDAIDVLRLLHDAMDVPRHLAITDPGAPFTPRPRSSRRRRPRSSDR